MLIISYCLTAFTDPGGIPDNQIWKIPIEDDMPEQIKVEIFMSSLNKREELLESNRNTINEENLNESRSTASNKHINDLATSSTNEDDDTNFIINERTDNGSVRNCITCKKFKPDRSHHCKFCKKCILKLDHHCPWIGNCIGYRNYKYFVSMIFYGLLNSTYFNYIFYDVIKFLIIEDKIIDFKLISFMSLYFFMIILMVGVFFFNIFHTWITLNNNTTYELMINNRNKKNGKKNDLMHYNISYYENWKQVHSANPLVWFLPIRLDYSSAKWNNGINFKINRKFKFEVVKSV